MIHSMSGGELTTHGKHDYAKVEILEGERAGDVLWFVSSFPQLKTGDKVLVPLSRFASAKAKVLRVDKDVDEFSFPIPIKRLKYIVEIINE